MTERTPDDFAAMGRRSGEVQRERAAGDPDFFHRRQAKGWESRRASDALDARVDPHFVTGNHRAAMTLREQLGEQQFAERMRRLSAAGNAARRGKA